ncbi:hypothetical protein LINGRAHAP2_LOCUS9077 [Linum grandiflorum]
MEANSSASSSATSSINRPSKRKLHTAPLPPNPPRVYQVDPVNFRDLVQRLTGSTSDTVMQPPQRRRMQSLAPPPPEEKELLPTRRSGISNDAPSPLTVMCRELMMDDDTSSSLELNLSSSAGVDSSSSQYWYPRLLSNGGSL